MTVKTLLPEWGKRTYVMGIINVTPDSFSGDGLLQHEHPVSDALKQAQAFVSAGADILDIGAESTRPGARAVSIEEEIRRLVPVIECLAENLPETWISVDTYKAEAAQASIAAGANWINDVWALQADPAMAEVAAATGAPLILMHNRSRPSDVSLQKILGGRYTGVEYENLLEDVKNELMRSVDIALEAGVKKECIILDPGIGFGKTLEQNLELVNRLREIVALGFPVLLGPSRKSFIGYTLNLPPDQRAEGTAAAVAIGIDRGADIIRVHDVEIMTRLARMTDAIVRSRSKSG